MLFTRINITAVCLALGVIMLGAFVRLSDAGLGCPDWPGCYGHITVPDAPHHIDAANQAFPERPLDSSKAWKEMVHRYFASALGLLILVMALLSLRRSDAARVPRILPWGLVILVIMQGLLGMWTVTLLLKPLVVTLHLLGGMATLLLLALCLLRQGRLAAGWRLLRRRGLRLAAGGAFVLLAGQVFLGAWTSANYAALACPDFPTCQAYWWPPTDYATAFTLWHGLPIDFEFGILDSVARATIHWTHRLGAIVIAVVMAALVLLLWRHGREDRRWRRLAGLLLAAVALQIGLGVSVVVLHLPLAVAVAHNGGAALLLLVVMLINYAAWNAQSHG